MIARSMVWTKDHPKGWKNELPYVSIGKRGEENGDMNITFSSFLSSYHMPKGCWGSGSFPLNSYTEHS